MFFLKQVDDHFEFVSSYFPALVAVRTSQPVGSTDLEKVADSLGAVLRISSDKNAQRQAISALGTIRNATATLALRSALGKSEDVVRLSAAAALLSLNDAAGLAIAEQYLEQLPAGAPEDIVHNLRYGIASGLRDPAAIPSLSRLMRSTVVENRRAAVAALANTGSPTALASLARALEDSDVDVQYLAVRGLAEITGQSDRSTTKDVFSKQRGQYLGYWIDWARARGLVGK
jgi:HEAT repeat protein